MKRRRAKENGSIRYRSLLSLMFVIGVVSIASVFSASLRIEPQAQTWPLVVIDEHLNNTIQSKDDERLSLSGRDSHVLEPLAVNDTSWMGDEYKDTECLPIAMWHLKKYSPYSCNMLHELDMDPVTSGLSLINCGGSRCAFRVFDSQGGANVLKTAKINRDLNSPDSAWKDAIIMERLSSSPFVLNIYGNCGISQVVEVAEDYLYTQLLNARQCGDQMTSEQKLRIAYHVAAGVADLHSIDGNFAPSVVHNDISSEQFLLVNGIYKLNDFHAASFITRNRQGNNCKEGAKGMHRDLDKSRAPEEIRYRYGNSNENIDRDKADVWIMGCVMYYVLTKRWDFDGITVQQARNLLMNGNHSEIPLEYIHSTHAADQAMVQALEMTWKANPEERPSARAVADYLRGELEKLSSEGAPLYRVMVPEFSPDYVYDETEWYKNYRMGRNS